MIGIICPVCHQPKPIVHPNLQWARNHNPNLPLRSFVYLDDVIQSKYEIKLEHLFEGGYRFHGYLWFCRGHEDAP